MSRLKLIKQLKEKNPKLNRSEIEAVIDVFTKSISKALKKGHNVEIRGLGRWHLREFRENFSARNPATNELIYKPKRVKVKFRASKKLSKIINE